MIGCGWWLTEAHLPAISENPRAQLSALVDPDARRRAAAAERFPPLAQYAGVDELLSEGRVDAVICAVPHNLHHPLAARCLDAGLHTLVEKPMTINPADARDLVARASEAGVELLVGYPWHYEAQAVELRRAIGAGRIGPIEYVSCLFASVARELYNGNPEALRQALGYSLNAPGANTYSDRSVAGGGQGQTQLTHAAALLLWLTGLHVSEVAGYTADFELPVDLANAVSLRFGSGAIGVLGSTGSVVAGLDEILEYRIFGRDGDIVFNVLEGRATIRDASGIEHLPDVAPIDRYPQWAPSGNLVDVVLGTGVNASPGVLGCEVVELVDAMYRSAASRSVVVLPDDRH